MYPLGFLVLSFAPFTVNEVTPLKLLDICRYTLFLNGRNIAEEFPISSYIFGLRHRTNVGLRSYETKHSIKILSSEISKYNKCKFKAVTGEKNNPKSVFHGYTQKKRQNKS